jgi:pyruvate kinase
LEKIILAGIDLGIRAFTEHDRVCLELALDHISPAAVFVPTRSGLSARRITRFRLPVWIVAISSKQSTCQELQFSYGVCPVCEPKHPENWNLYVGSWLKEQGVEADLVVLTEGPSSKHPEANNRMEIMELKKELSAVSGQPSAGRT